MVHAVEPVQSSAVQPSMGKIKVDIRPEWKQQKCEDGPNDVRIRARAWQYFVSIQHEHHKRIYRPNGNGADTRQKDPFQQLVGKYESSIVFFRPVARVLVFQTLHLADIKNVMESQDKYDQGNEVHQIKTCKAGQRYVAFKYGVSDDGPLEKGHAEIQSGPWPEQPGKAKDHIRNRAWLGWPAKYWMPGLNSTHYSHA